MAYYFSSAKEVGRRCNRSCLCVCLSAGLRRTKVIKRFRWNLVLWWLSHTNGKNRLIFGGDSVPGTDFESLFYFHQHCRIGDFRRFVSICHIVTGRFSRNSAKWLTPTRERSGRLPNPD